MNLVPQSTIIGFYIVAIGMLILVSAPLFYLRLNHTYSWWSLALGLGTYFIAYQLFTNYVWDRLYLISGLMDFLGDHYLLNYLAYVFLTALSLSPAAYILLKFTRKNKWNIFEAVAGGMSYWIFGGIYSAYNFISQARIASIYNSGDISSLLSDSVTEAQVEEYAEMLCSGTLADCIAQLTFFAAEIALVVLLFIIVYHGVKRKKIRYMFLAAAAHFVLILACYLGSTLSAIFYILICLAVIAVCLFIIYRYFQWYYQRQQELNQQRQEIKERRHAAYVAKTSGQDTSGKQ